MDLISSCPHSAQFFMRNKRMFLDSCVLNELSNDANVAELIKEASQYFSIFISAISLLEVGFGPRNKAGLAQQELAIDLYTNPNIVKVRGDSIDSSDPISSKKSGRRFLYIPDDHEWFAARHNLMEWMDSEDVGGASARKQTNDALIFMCAWNANSFLITDNTRDFTRFNRIMYQKVRGHLPIFTIDDLRRSKNEQVIFPENVPNYSIPSIYHF